MADTAVSYPCGYCGTQVVPGADACPRCGIRLIDVSRHPFGYAAKEFVLDALDRAADRANAILATPAARKAIGRAAAAAAVAGAAMIGYRLLARREA